jgi:hypothetical protein
MSVDLGRHVLCSAETANFGLLPYEPAPIESYSREIQQYVPIGAVFASEHCETAPTPLSGTSTADNGYSADACPEAAA